MLHVAVWASTDPTALARAVRAEVAELDVNQAVSEVQTMEQLVGDSLAQRRFAMLTMIGFGLGGILLAAIGLYGVTAYTVGQRTQEIGVRMALGARSGTVLAMVFRQAGAVVLAGLVVGVAGALMLSRFVAGMVYGVSPRDPLTLLGVSLLLVAVAAIATYVPALRAARVDPMIAIRSH